MADLPLPKERRLHFTSQVNQDSIGKITTEIIDINANDEYLMKLYDIHGLSYTPKPIEIYIDSYGGSVYQVFGLLGVMETSKTPIHTYATGTAMSCGFLMLIFGHKRFGYKYSTILYHQVSGWVHGELKTMLDDVKESKRLQKIIEKMTTERTKITKKRLKEVYATKTDWFFTSETALELGVIDEII